VLAKRYDSQQFLGIDNQPDAIEQASDKMTSNLSFETMDVLTLPFTNDFDAIISFNCLLWVKDKQTALKNIFQALKPGGKAFLQLFAIHGRPKNDRFLFQISQSQDWQHYFKDFKVDYFEVTLGELYHLLQSLGFIIHGFEFAKYETQFSHPDALCEWMRSWATHQNNIPIEKRRSFMQETTLSYLKFHQYEPQEPFPYQEYLLEVICEKPAFSNTNTLNTYQFDHLSFTKKEAFVLKHFLQGKTAKEIAILSTITAKTVEFHLARIKEKLNCYRRSEIYQSAINYGFINLIFDNKL
jgi:trans-aconitate methyltransferase/DNA-binding CsgD family transcriptional regulator